MCTDNFFPFIFSKVVDKKNRQLDYVPKYVLVLVLKDSRGCMYVLLMFVILDIKNSNFFANNID